jgi:hypothetical protein
MGRSLIASGILIAILIKSPGKNGIRPVKNAAFMVNGVISIKYTAPQSNINKKPVKDAMPSLITTRDLFYFSICDGIPLINPAAKVPAI